jgi:hypothetical protein
MAAAYLPPGVHRPSDVEEIVVLSRTGLASNRSRQGIQQVNPHVYATAHRSPPGDSNKTGSHESDIITTPRSRR